MSIYQKLQNIQEKLKAPKNQYNNFGKYSYRSCEDILEGIKPLLKENGCVLVITDEIQQIGERYYVKAIVKLIDIESGTEIAIEALAREEESKKGMDGSQVTGAASSYARKYALNGLFAIDDTKDADSSKSDKDQPKESSSIQGNKFELSDAQIKRAYAIAKKSNINEDGVKKWIQTAFKKNSIKELTKPEYDQLCAALENPKKAV